MYLTCLYSKQSKHIDVSLNSFIGFGRNEAIPLTSYVKTSEKLFKVSTLLT